MLSGVGSLPDGGRDRPDPKLLCGDRLATDRIRVSSHQHPVLHRGHAKLWVCSDLGKFRAREARVG
jgi:hypothetical protein